MNFLRKLYPGSFKLKKNETKPFVIKLVTFVLIGIVFNVAFTMSISICHLGIETYAGSALGMILVIVEATLTLIYCMISVVIDSYLIGGILISIFKFVGIIKDQASEAENTSLNKARDKVGGIDNVVSAAEDVVNKVVDKPTKKTDGERKDSQKASEETTEADAE